MFNEEPNLEALYQQLRQTLESLPGSYELLFVDDGSTDGGGRLLDDLADRDPRMKVCVPAQFRPDACHHGWHRLRRRRAARAH